MHPIHTLIQIYYDFQLSKVREKFGHKVATFKLQCCQGQLAPFPRVTFRALTSFSDKARENLPAVCFTCPCKQHSEVSSSYGVSSESRIHCNVSHPLQ